jgi:Tfp pilus assembly protein PilZ
MDNRRRYPRIRSSETAMLTIRGGEQSPLDRHSHFCPIQDVSLGGIRVGLHEAIDTGDQIAVIVAFDTPPERVMRMGRVAWVKETEGERPYMTGLEFSDAGGARSHVWRDLMTRRFPEAVPLFSEAPPDEPDISYHPHDPQYS